MKNALIRKAERGPAFGADRCLAQALGLPERCGAARRDVLLAVDVAVRDVIVREEESVDALEGLFSELLDITRIDTGGVEVHPDSFAMGEIFRKIRLHCEPAAFEKGLNLRVRGDQHVAHADPLLVERIVRNLVGNAIRYTRDGTVLLSCRQRGERLLLQVWDTGPGIREEERARVFEEFYQVPGTATGTAEQKKGLGLGLAIVKRLAGLMNAPLALASQVGRGTVFTLELPVGQEARSPTRKVPGKGPVGHEGAFDRNALAPRPML
jgi:signal transduction histidine kinase